MAVLEDIAATLLERTRDGKLDWEQLSGSGFYTRVGPNTITIDLTPGPILTGRPGVGGGLYVLRFTNEKGTVIQTIQESSENYDQLHEIYELARRQALRVDDTLLTIKRALDSL